MIPSYLATDFPYCFRMNGITLHCRNTEMACLFPSIEEVLQERLRRNVQKLLQHISAPSGMLCCKVCDVAHFASRMRIALCRKRRDGRFDWELGEFVHSVAAAKAGATVPAVLGYGYRSARFGLPRETVLLSEWLEGYTDLRAWMSANPDGVVGMTRRIIQLVMRLIELRIIHLDLWIGNILSPLLPPKIVDENMPMVVDWENAWIWDVPYPAQAMGYMLGFLFHYELQCHLDEAAFDALVLEALAAMPQLDRPAFETIYTFAKHHHISRKTRWRIVTEGRLP